MTSGLTETVGAVRPPDALAVAEACRTDAVLGAEAGARVRIKWPNDLYAVTREGERKKIGGILVNTSFGSGNVELVVGASRPLLSLLVPLNVSLTCVHVVHS